MVALCLIYLYPTFYITHKYHIDCNRCSMNVCAAIQSPHGLSCDGIGIAKDDLNAIETVEELEEVVRELFHNAARIHKAMRSNHLLRPIFRKYREACREILQQKREEAEQFARLADYCDDCAHDPHQLRHDLNCIQYELKEIHEQMKTLEDLQWTDDDSESDCSSDCSDSDEESEPDAASDESDESDESDDSGLSDVTEFLRQSLIE